MGAGHDHGSGTNVRRLGLALGLTSVVVLAQVVGSVVTGSLALLVDTAHMLTDAGGLAMALLAARLMRRPASVRHTWGLKRAEVLSAMAQAALLFGVGMFALVEGVRRLADPPEVPSDSLLVFGIIGLVANLLALAILVNGRGDNLNMRAAFLEVTNDALGSVAVIVSAIVITTTGWLRADAVAGIAIALLIVPRTVILLRATTSVLLESTPKGLDLDEVRRHIMSQPHVVDVHDLHASQISTDLPILTAHVTMEDGCFVDGHAIEVLARLQSCVAGHFPVSVEHSTFQIEPESHARAEHIHHH